MKKRKLLKGTAIGAAIAGVMLGGCRPQTVYGPPPDTTDDYDPGTMVVEDVYGPPEYFDSTYESETEESATEATDTTFSPEDMDVEEVYGPPADETRQQAETEKTQPNTYHAEDNMPELVYGPPEYFENMD